MIRVIMILIMIALNSTVLFGQTQKSLIIKTPEQLKNGIPSSIIALTFKGEEIDDDAIKRVKKNLNVISLYLNGTKISSKGFGRLLKLFPKMEILEFSRCDLTKGFAKSFKNFRPNLRCLELYACNVDDQFFSDIAKAKKIRKLWMTKIDGLSRKSFSSIFKINKLWDLSLKAIKSTKDNIFKDLKKSKKTYMIKIYSCDFFTDEVFQSFKGSAIMHLQVIKSPVTEKSLDVFLNLPNLIELKTDVLSKSSSSKIKKKYKKLTLINVE